MVIKENVMITPWNLERTLHIYLPHDYDQSDECYPVLYMFDGHNLFYDEDATYGKSWGLKDYLDQQRKKIIVVGIECNHEGNERICEYSPYSFESSFLGSIQGRGKELMDWVCQELKPYIDASLRTLPQREHSAIGGSSMGGLMALYSISMYQETFSKAACLSSFLAEVYDALMQDLDHDVNPNTKVYISWGSEEVKSKLRLVNSSIYNLMAGNMLSAHHASVYYNLVKGGRHCEASWEKEIPQFMNYLF